MEFQKLTRDHIPLVRPFFQYAPWRTCDYSVGGMFMWRHFYDMEFCICEDVFFSRQVCDGMVQYNVPLSKDIQEALRLLTEEVLATKAQVTFCTVPEDALPMLLSLGYAEEVTEMPDLADYLYQADAMVTFSGRHLAGARNHMKHFVRDHGTIRFEAITEDNVADAKAFFLSVYSASSQQPSAFEQEENRMTKEVLDHFREYGFQGGILYADHCVAGFSFGEQVGDTFFVHIEKSRRDCDGCYQTLTNQFANLISGKDVAFMNREEDMGDPGLRYAKQSYHPLKLIKKYQVTLKR